MCLCLHLCVCKCICMGLCVFARVCVWVCLCECHLHLPLCIYMCVRCVSMSAHPPARAQRSSMSAGSWPPSGGCAGSGLLSEKLAGQLSRGLHQRCSCRPLLLGRTSPFWPLQFLKCQATHVFGVRLCCLWGSLRNSHSLGLSSVRHLGHLLLTQRPLEPGEPSARGTQRGRAHSQWSPQHQRGQ